MVLLKSAFLETDSVLYTWVEPFRREVPFTVREDPPCELLIIIASFAVNIPSTFNVLLKRPVLIAVS